MKCCLVALGKTGARYVRSMLDAVMSGLFELETVHIIAFGIQDEDRVTLTSLLDDYERVRSQLLGEGTPLFQCRVYADFVVEDALDASLMEKCGTAEDRLLMQTLFSGDRTLSRAAGGTMETAQVAWADLMEEGAAGSGLLGAACAQAEDTLFLLAASLAEPFGAAGVPSCLRFFAEHGAPRTGAVLMLPVHKGDRTDLAGSALREIHTVKAPDALYLYGLPEDVRTEGTGLEEMVGLCLMDHFLRGGSGAYTFASALETPQWGFFGERAEAYESALLDLLHASCLMLLRYGPDALERFGGAGMPGMRGWFGRLYGEIRHEPEKLGAQRDYLQSLLHMLRFHMAWCYLATGALPLSLRYHAQLEETNRKASEYYDSLLHEAGLFSLLSYDLRVSGITEEETVHRYSMADTEAEKARKKITEQAEKVKAMAAAMEEMEEVLGGRETLLLLQAKADRALEEADALAAQGEEAEKRIEEAARKAGAGDMPKVDAARSRLQNLKRHLEYLRGRAAYAGRDVREARLEERRSRMPKVEYVRGEDPDVLFDRRVLKQMLAVYDKAPHDRKRAAQPLLDSIGTVELSRVMQRFEGSELQGTGTTGLFLSLMDAGRMEREAR